MKEKKKLSLSVWIFIGMIAGILVGLCFLKTPEFTTDYLKPIGTIYINLLKFLVVPVVLFSITDGVVSLKDLKRVGSVGLRTFVYYMFTTAIAVVIGLVLANVFKGAFPLLQTTGLEYEAKESPSVMQVIVNIFPDNLLKPMVSADMLPVIVVAIFFGAGILAAGDDGIPVGGAVARMNKVIMQIMMMIIKFTPIGVLCLMANVVAVNGPAIVGNLLIVIGVAYLGYIIHVVLVYSLSVKVFAKMSPIKFFKGVLPAAVFAFTSTSSVASLPVSKECCDEMGVENDISSFVLPLGATINMDGTAIYQCVAAIFLAKCIGVDLTMGQMVTIVVTATLASIGTAGTSGAGMIMLAMVLDAVGIDPTYIGLIYGVDRLFDMGRTSLNVIGDASCAICVNYWEGNAKKAAAKKA